MDNKFKLWHDHKLDPEWVESIPFYEYQIWVDKVNKAVEEDNKKSLEETGMKEAFNFSKPN